MQVIQIHVAGTRRWNIQTVKVSDAELLVLKQFDFRVRPTPSKLESDIVAAVGPRAPKALRKLATRGYMELIPTPGGNTYKPRINKLITYGEPPSCSVDTDQEVCEARSELMAQ